MPKRQASDSNEHSGPIHTPKSLSAKILGNKLANAVDKQVNEAITRPLTEKLQALKSTSSGDSVYYDPNDKPNTDYLNQLHENFPNVLNDLTQIDQYEIVDWTAWVRKVSGGHLEDATQNRLIDALKTFETALDFSKTTLQHAASNLVMSKALESTKVIWPSDLNTMQTYSHLMSYSNLHTFELTLPPHSWSDEEVTVTIEESLLQYVLDLRTYSASHTLMERLLGNWVDWRRLPPHELFLWNRISGCDLVRTRLLPILNALPTPPLPLRGEITEGDYRKLQSRSLTRTWFYLCLPANVILRSINVWTTDINRKGSTWESAELEFKTHCESGPDWIQEGGNLNFHFTARGALAMALFVYGALGRTEKRHFANERLVLLRFRLPMRYVLKGYANTTLRLWNRLYFEHSLHSITTLKLDVLALQTMQSFWFNHLKPTQHGCYTLSQIYATQQVYLHVMKDYNFFESHHILLPMPLQKILEKDAETKKRPKRTED